MPKKKKSTRLRLISLLLAVAGALIWQFTPVQAVFALSNLIDPAKLQTLGERGANPRINKAVYWLHVARTRNLPPETAIDWACALNRIPEPRASLLRESLLRNLNSAVELGLLTDDNLDRLRHGNAGIITRGPYQGETVEIDHIVPISLAPETGNEPANLEMLPRTLNRRKSASVGERQLAHARRLHEAGLLDAGSLARLHARVRPPE